MKVKRNKPLPTIRELIDRPEINPGGGCMEWARKMTYEELIEWERQTRAELIKDGTKNKFPDINAAQLAKEIDRDIIYNMLKEQRQTQESKEIFNKAKNGTT